MNLRSAAVLACRILAIVALMILLQSSAQLLSLFASAFGSNGYLPEQRLPVASLLLYLSPMALLLVFAIVLWTRADSIAVCMVTEADGSDFTLPIDERTQALAFSVLGVYVLTGDLPQISRMLISAWEINSQPADVYRNWTGLGAPDFIFVFMQIALGLWLLFGARGLVTLLANVRHLGRDKASVRQEDENNSVSLRPKK